MSIIVPPGMQADGLKRIAQWPDSFSQKQTPIQRTIRALAGYGTSSTDITAGALCTITAFRKDFDDTHITELDFATVTTNLITLTRPGYYVITYHAALSIELTEAATVNPSTTIGKTVLRIGGSTDLGGTEGYVTMTEIPNLNDFVETDGNPVDISTDVGGATGKTAAFDTESFALASGSGSGFGLTPDTLDPSNQQAVTLDASQPIDATTNLSAVTTTPTAAAVKGSTSGTAIVTVRYNASNALKIFVGVTEYSPTIGVQGSRESGTADVLNLSTSISLIKLF